MNRPDLYIDANELQRSASSMVLHKYLVKLKFPSSYLLNILDIGSGCGDTSVEILLPKLPENINQFIGIDISLEMVQFSNTRYKNVDKVTFQLMDIATKYIPSNFEGYFDFIFSFFCLHWVNQRKAFKNIFQLLRPDGVALLTFLIKLYQQICFTLVSKTSKWSSLFEGIEDNNDKDKSLDELKNELTELNFRIIDVEIEDMRYKFNSVDEYKKRKLNTWIRNKTRVVDVAQRIASLKWQWTGHLMRIEDNKWSRKVLEWMPRLEIAADPEPGGRMISGK